ncbi:hypothetical protein Bca52824_025170 [Brassica carinata]|uniref:Uncharacterized protein n=1 Tax=Brassica carinata TaxID=52824 RepID=A0A8X8AWM5_BRACI|nr:hypothetical protein Bca52824_025170 [Brassica carinata]
MRDHDKGKHVEDPGVETKVWNEPWFHQSMRMVLVAEPKSGSCHWMGDWTERWINPKGMSFQESRATKSHESPEITSSQRVTSTIRFCPVHMDQYMACKPGHRLGAKDGCGQAKEP